MTKPAAFFGNYSDLKFVRTRKVAVISIEIPIEDAARFIEAFGAPNPAAEIPVALARLVNTPEQKEQLPAPEKRKLSLASQAALRCNEPDFRRFLDQEVCTVNGWEPPSNADEAAQVVRHFCKVSSRSELNDNTQAAETWKRLEADYWAWQRGMH